LDLLGARLALFIGRDWFVARLEDLLNDIADGPALEVLLAVCTLREEEEFDFLTDFVALFFSFVLLPFF
jgi:hypothetical protein